MSVTILVMNPLSGPAVRPNILEMTPYSPGKPIDEVKRELGLDRVVKLASNENPLGPSPKALEAIAEAAKSLHIYPDGASYNLRHKLSERFGLPMNQVIVGNGSDELLHLIGLLFLDGPNDNIIVGYPSFSRYDASAYLANAELVRVPLNGDYAHDLQAMADAVNENTRLVYVANPNNPTGTIVTKAEFDAFLDRIPERVMVILDEAYYEFAADQTEYPNSLDYVKAGRNVIGMRTFSKAYGLAGIRLGYAFVPGYICDAIDRAREPFNVNLLAQAAGVAAIGDDEYVARTVAVNREGLDRLNAAFEKVGAKPVKSFANFVFADLGQPAKPIFEALLKEGVITRSGHVLGAPNCLRVSVGTPDEIDYFIEKLFKVMNVSPVGEPASAATR